MKKLNVEKNWVSKQVLIIMLAVWLVLLMVGILFHKFQIIIIISTVLSMLMLLFVLFFFYTHYKLSPKGGNLQSLVSRLVTTKIDKKSIGCLLDIGCGCGILSVELAIKCPSLKIQAIDYWGSTWGYSKEKCERLAVECNVSDHIRFVKANASSLPFEDETFDIVISNMVFHEVADAKNKREVIKEAFRVLKKGGQFVFQDLFLSKKLYGVSEDLVQYVKYLGVEFVSFKRLQDEIIIPRLLNIPMFFGDTAILTGRK